METIDYDPTVHQTDEGDKKLSVIYYNSFIKNEAKSIEAGRLVCDDVPFTKIFMPGDRTNIIDRPTRESDKLRFPMQWGRFKNAQEQRADGTPLTEWPIVSRGMAEELKYLGFTTVEQVAEANDNVNMLGLQDLKSKARVYLQVAKGNTAPVEKLSADLKEMMAQNKVLMETVDHMKTQIGALQSGKK